MITDGGNIKTTSYMVGRWIKACFLLVLGIVILFYADKFVQDLRANAEGHFDVTFEWTWNLITWLLWILVAWLFVDAGLTIALSFTEQRHTIGDVAKRLERIERKLGIQESDSEVKTSETEAEGWVEKPSESGKEQATEAEPPPPT